jgi:hypothetical protein
MMRPAVRTIAVFLLLSTSLLGQASPAVSRAEARKIIVDLNREWGKARVAFDKPTFERMLASDFYVQLPDQKLTRREFIDEISAPPRGGKLTRFDVEVLTVEPSGDAWVAVIEEKLEFARADEKGTVYSLWVTRDRWKKFGDRWMALSSEAIGNENWRDGARPPFPNW